MTILRFHLAFALDRQLAQERSVGDGPSSRAATPGGDTALDASHPTAEGSTEIVAWRKSEQRTTFDCL